MRVAERTTPIAALIAALSTLACCLPFTFLGALGLAGASMRLSYHVLGCSRVQASFWLSVLCSCMFGAINARSEAR